MLGKQQKIEDLKLKNAINRLLDEMEEYGPDSEEYAKNLRHLERLTELQTKTRPNKVSRDTLVLSLASFGQVALIVIYEQKHVFRSVATNFITKVR